MTVELSEVRRDKFGLQQSVTYEHAGRIRREIFCGRTSKELGDAVEERVQELRRSNGRRRKESDHTSAQAVGS
jgi:hypothetical protein